MKTEKEKPKTKNNGRINQRQCNTGDTVRQRMHKGRANASMTKNKFNLSPVGRFQRLSLLGVTRQRKDRKVR